MWERRDTVDKFCTHDISEDSDWYDQEITFDPGHQFRVGDAVFIQATNSSNGVQENIKRMLVARQGNRFKLNDGLRKNIWLSGKPKGTSVFPLLTSEFTEDVVIEDCLDEMARTTLADGNYGGAIFLQDCNRYTIRGVTTTNYNGGISFVVTMS